MFKCSKPTVEKVNSLTCSDRFGGGRDVELSFNFSWKDPHQNLTKQVFTVQGKDMRKQKQSFFY